MEHVFINENDFYSKIKLKTLQKKGNFKFEILFFGFSIGIPSFLILKDIFEQSKNHLKTLKLNDKISVIIDNEPFEFKLTDIRKKEIWENLTVESSDGDESYFSIWELKQNFKLNSKIQKQFKIKIFKKLSEIYKSMDKDTLELLNSTSNYFSYRIDFSILLERLKNSYYRCLNSFRFDFEHLMKISNSSISQYKEFQKIFKEIFGLDIEESDDENDQCFCTKKCDRNCINFISVNKK